MEFHMERGGLPAGSYQAKFLGIEEFDKHPEFGPAVSLKFEVIAGERAGAMASRILQKKMTLQSGLGRWACGLNGGPIAVGQRFSFDDVVGIVGELTVGTKDDGTTRPESFKRTTAPSASNEMRF
jgi:hypothetical protein